MGSIKKCRTSSFDGSPDLVVAPAGGVATFKARPKAPGKELESRTTNVPGGLSLSIAIAGEEEGYVPSLRTGGLRNDGYYAEHFLNLLYFGSFYYNYRARNTRVQ